MTVEQAVNWCNGQVGQSLDFDGQFGSQCTDFFNFYYQTITGRNPYSDGYGVPGAKDIWDVPTDLFDKVPNDMSDPNQLPPQGAIIIWSGNLQGSEGYGHVGVVDSADAKNVTVWDQNWGGQYVHHQNHMWTGTEIGWLVFKGFDQPAPPPPPTPAPESQPEPAPAPPPEPTPESTPSPEPVPTPEPTPDPLPTPEPPAPPVVIQPSPVPKPTSKPVAMPNKLIWAILAAIAGLLVWFFK